MEPQQSIVKLFTKFLFFWHLGRIETQALAYCWCYFILPLNPFSYKDLFLADLCNKLSTPGIYLSVYRTISTIYFAKSNSDGENDLETLPLWLIYMFKRFWSFWILTQMAWITRNATFGITILQYFSSRMEYKTCMSRSHTVINLLTQFYFQMIKINSKEIYFEGF